MDLKKAKVFGEMGTIILLSFVLLRIFIYASPFVNSLSLNKIVSYIWILVFRKGLFSDLLFSLDSFIGLTLIVIGIMFIPKHYKNKKILVWILILAGIFILEMIISSVIRLSLSSPVQGTTFYGLAHWINSLSITKALMHFVSLIYLFFYTLEAILALILFVYTGRLVNEKSFYFAGIFYFVSAILFMLLAFFTNTLLFRSLILINNFNSLTVDNLSRILYLIANIILAVSYFFLLRGFLRIKNNKLTALEA